MEDQIVEWRVMEHISTLEEEEDEEGEEEERVKESNVRWILKKGLGLGKKVVITGIVISSAPLVLPPLIVISAVGFAFSIPSGLAFACYACTEKLMSKLLPRPASPPLLEYEEMYSDEEEQFGGKRYEFGEEMMMAEEEKKEMEDSKERVEKRIELVMEESRGYEEEPTLVEDRDEGPKDFGKAEEEREINVNEVGKGEGCEDDVGEYLEGENEGPMKEMNLEIERQREDDNWAFSENLKKTEGLDLVAREARGEDEIEKDVTLTPGLPDRNLVEVYVGDDAVKEDKYSLEHEGMEGEKDIRGAEVEKPSQSEDAKLDDLVRKSEQTKTETGTEGLDPVARGARGEDEIEKDVTLAPSLPYRNLVEVYVGDDAVKEDKHSLEHDGMEAEKDIRGAEVEKPLESKDAKLDDLVRKSEETKTETGTGVTSEEKESIEETKKPHEGRSSKKHHKKKKGHGGKHDAMPEKGEILSDKKQEDNNVKMVKIMEELKHEVEGKEDEKHLPVTRETKEGTDEVNQSGVTKKADKAAEMDKSPGSKDARTVRDVAQAGKSTKDQRTGANGKHVAKDVSGPLEGKEPLVAKKDAQRKTTSDVHKNLSSERKGTSNQNRHANESGVHLVSGRAGHPKSKQKEVLFSEEKIWEKINAMRTIVGYTAMPQFSLIGELKALYIFTGVEPPPSFSDPSDLGEVNDKVQFLMSIVGIK